METEKREASSQRMYSMDISIQFGLSEKILPEVLRKAISKALESEDFGEVKITISSGENLPGNLYKFSLFPNNNLTRAQITICTTFFHKIIQRLSSQKIFGVKTVGIVTHTRSRAKFRPKKR